MKKIILLLIVSITTFGLQNVSATSLTVSGELTHIQNSIGTKYKGEDSRIEHYNISRLDHDIKKSGENCGNGIDEDFSNIQLASKSKDWSKERFMYFVTLMEKKDTQKAAVLLEKYWDTIDPFHARGDCIGIPDGIFAVKGLKNGIVSISGGGQDNPLTFRLSYQFIQNKVFYEISTEFPLYYYASWYWNEKSDLLFQCREVLSTYPSDLKGLYAIIGKNGCQIVIDTKKSKKTIKDAVNGLLKQPSTNKIFQNIYNEFISDMTKIWK